MPAPAGRVGFERGVVRRAPLELVGSTVTIRRMSASTARRLAHGLRNVALVQDLRASRLRIMTAQDQRARKLERDIHDGAQQQLVALAVKLRLADTMVGRDDGKAREMLAELGSEANDALETLRDLARGIYPPLLHRDGYLVFEVTDDGRGFDPDRVDYGTGLQGIADRLAALGGTLDVSSAPDAGTSIRGSLPVETDG